MHCFNVSSLVCCFDFMLNVSSLCHHFNKAFMYVCMYVCSTYYLKPTVSVRPSFPLVAHTSASDLAFGRHCAL